MKKNLLILPFAIALIVSAAGILPALGMRPDFSPKPEEQQLPQAMHSAMKELPGIIVGKESADLIGNDNRVLQAAVDYIAGLGGGIVEIGEGEYAMHDSLHLRSNVTARGKKGKTILRKADGVTSALALDGDFGEQQVTVEKPPGFAFEGKRTIWYSKTTSFVTPERMEHKRKPQGFASKSRSGRLSWTAIK